VASNLAGTVGRVYIPSFLRKPLFGLYAKTYGVLLDDMVRPLEDYSSFVDFFTRQVKPRQLDPQPAVVVAPADSKVLTVCEVKGNDVLLIKGMTYGLGEFLTGRREERFSSEDIEKIKKADQSKEKTKIYSAIFYLSPGDYHRYHSPCDFAVKSRKHIVGYLYPVKISYIEHTPRVYEDNERVALFGEWEKGLMTQVYVGATNVGSMTLTHEGPSFDTDKLAAASLKKVNDLIYPSPVKLAKGQEVGMFRLGSTVVMIFEAPEKFQWSIKEGDSVRFGQPIGRY
jgi:phosphatidylserine decarboxylase